MLIHWRQSFIFVISSIISLTLLAGGHASTTETSEVIFTIQDDESGSLITERLIQALNEKIVETRATQSVNSLKTISIALKIEFASLADTSLIAHRFAQLNATFKLLYRYPAMRHITSLCLSDCGLTEVPNIASFAKPSFTMLNLSNNPLEKYSALAMVSNYLQVLKVPNRTNTDNIEWNSQQEIRSYAEKIAQAACSPTFSFRQREREDLQKSMHKKPICPRAIQFSSHKKSAHRSIHVTRPLGHKKPLNPSSHPMTQD